MDKLQKRLDWVQKYREACRSMSERGVPFEEYNDLVLERLSDPALEAISRHASALARFLYVIR